MRALRCDGNGLIYITEFVTKRRLVTSFLDYNNYYLVMLFARRRIRIYCRIFEEVILLLIGREFRGALI